MMIKKISYLCLAFTFSFLVFVYNVKAVVHYNNRDYNNLNRDYFSPILDYLSYNDVVFLNNYFNNSDYDFCILSLTYSNSRLQFYCYTDLDFSNITIDYIYPNLQFIFPNYGSTKYDFYFNSDFSNLDYYYESTQSIPRIEFAYDRSGVSLLPFWSRDEIIFNSNRGDYFIIDDSIYDSIDSRLKTHYNFKNYFVSGYPLYTYVNLILGNWRGFTGNVELINCFDSICDSSGQLFSYKYGSVGESIDLSSYLDNSVNNYLLDTNYNYSILAGQTQTLNIYYYSTQVNFSVNYYFDNVLQSSLTQSLSGSSGSVITLNNLDMVKDNIYFLDNSLSYTITLSSSSDNIINVYYNSFDTNYDINVYLDDIYYKSYSSVGTGKVGQTISLDNLDQTIDIFTLDLREYEISLIENRELNYINVYYYSENYDTKYQDIDTTGKFYISFSWVDIKDRFNLNGLYTQTEQFIIVYIVNFLFYAIICFVAVFSLKILYKLINFIKMF